MSAQSVRTKIIGETPSSSTDSSTSAVRRSVSVVMPVDRDALAHQLLADEAAHLLVADAGEQRRAQAEPRGADGNVGRAAADRLGEGGDVLEPRADLLAVEVDRGAADGDDVERTLVCLRFGHGFASRRTAASTLHI